MALKDILEMDAPTKKIGLSEERVMAVLPIIRNYISFWREYPDLFVDFMNGPNGKFKFFYYQRVFIRVAMRHQYTYFVFPRAY